VEVPLSTVIFGYAIATAMNYQKAVSYIEALQAVIELGIELDHDRYGGKRKTEDGDE
jgi:hypothetical protein